MKENEQYMLFFHSMLDTVNNRSLPFCTDLLSALEGNKRHLEIMGCLLKGSPVRRLRKTMLVTADDAVYA